jgi:hypothetical protein
MSDSKNAELHMFKKELDERYISSADDDIESFIKKIDSVASRREARYLASDRTKSAKQFYQELSAEYIVIDDALWLSEISADYMSLISSTLEKAAATDVRIIASVDSKKMPMVAMDDYMKMLKNAERGILLGSIEQNVFNTGLLKMELPGDVAAIYENGSITKVKIPKAEGLV